MALLRGEHLGQGQERLMEAIGQAFEFVADLSTEPQEEERPWWK
jgi:hypothetical protein